MVNTTDDLIFNFKDVHEDARLTISFKRTLRLPDNVRLPYIPPTSGHFQLACFDDYEDAIPTTSKTHGGIMLAMYQSDAMYINFSGYRDKKRASPYPFAIKILQGDINGITGEQNESGLNSTPQDFLSYPNQSWLNGLFTSEGEFRQFVAKRLPDKNQTLQILVYAMKTSIYEQLYPRAERNIADYYFDRWGANSAEPMGIAPGGKINQQIFQSESESEKWDTSNVRMCFVHIANPLVWKEITKKAPLHEPFTRERYQQAGLEWHDYYNDDLQG
ncbi:MAG: hypothetical protein KIT34_04285 [Cyanobacteria bacterium TGS_CYA1]|nr:hypothetical protein [Cyanobacteria bacterium TGS_CYA1]